MTMCATSFEIEGSVATTALAGPGAVLEMLISVGLSSLAEHPSAVAMIARIRRSRREIIRTAGRSNR